MHDTSHTIYVNETMRPSTDTFIASTSTLNTDAGGVLPSPSPSTSTFGGSSLMRYAASLPPTRRSLVDTLSMRPPPVTIIHCPHCLNAVLPAAAAPYTHQLIDCRTCHQRMSVGGGARSAYRRHTTVAVELAIVCVVLVTYWCATRGCQICTFCFLSYNLYIQYT